MVRVKAVPKRHVNPVNPVNPNNNPVNPNNNPVNPNNNPVENLNSSLRILFICNSGENSNTQQPCPSRKRGNSAIKFNNVSKHKNLFMIKFEFNFTILCFSWSVRFLVVHLKHEDMIR